MKRIFLLIGMIPFYTLHAQKTKTAQNKLSIGFNFSPDYSFRGLTNKGGNESGDAVKQVRNDLEVAKFGYTTGLNICFPGSKFISLETGIQYSSKGYQTKNYDVTFSQPDPLAPVKVKYIYSYQYIGIPLRAKRSFGKGNTHFLLSAGFMTNFLLKARQTYIYGYADGRTTENSLSTARSYNKIDISPMISAGIDCAINDKIRLAAEPTFRYGIISTKNASLTEHLWSIGLNVGIYYQLR
jgi:hypothetical protein